MNNNLEKYLVERCQLRKFDNLWRNGSQLSNTCTYLYLKIYLLLGIRMNDDSSNLMWENQGSRIKQFIVIFYERDDVSSYTYPINSSTNTE